MVPSLPALDYPLGSFYAGFGWARAGARGGFSLHAGNKIETTGALPTKKKKKKNVPSQGFERRKASMQGMNLVAAWGKVPIAVGTWRRSSITFSVH